MSVLREKEHWGFKSGGTVQFDQMHQKILDIIKSDDNPFTGQDFFVNLKKREAQAKEKGEPFYVADYRKELFGFFEEWIKKEHEFPKYKYMINYLFANYPSASGKVEKHKDELFSQLEEMEQGKRTSLTVQAQDCMETIIDCLMRDFDEAKPSLEDREYYTREWIREQIIQPTEEFVFDFLAPVLEMLNEEVNVFLTRVLRREGMDVFNDNEFLLYLVLSCDFTESKFSTYKKLKSYYRNLEETEAVAEGTVYFMDSLEKQLDKMSDKTLSDVDGNFSKELVEILNWRKQLTHRDIRSGQETFEGILDELCILYAKEVEDYQKHIGDVNERANAGERRREGVVELVVSYDGRKEILIPAGTEFCGEHNLFEIQFDTKLPEKKSVTKIPVRSITAMEKAGEQILPLDAEVLMFNDEWMKKWNVTSVRTMTKEEKKGWGKDLPSPSFVKGKEDGIGYLCIECDYGHTIPSGTEFMYEGEDGIDYLFRSTEDVKAEAAKESIYITMKDRNNAVIIKKASANDPQNIWEETGGIQRLKRPIEGILSVYNPKRAGIRAGELAEETLKDGSARLTIRFPYDKVITLDSGTRFYNMTKKGKIYNMFVLTEPVTLKEEQTEKYFPVSVEPLTEMPSKVKKNKALKSDDFLVIKSGDQYPETVYAKVGNTEKPFRYKEAQSGKKTAKEKKILVSLKQGSILPAGAIFVYDDGKELLQYRTLETIEYTYGEMSGIRVECEGQNYKRRSNTGDLVYADAGTITKMDPEVKEKGIIFVTNPKAALKEENPPKVATREEFIDYLYSRKDAEAKDSIIDEVEGKLDFDMNLMREAWFVDAHLAAGKGEDFEKLPVEKKRALILTLAFMKYLKEKENIEQRMSSRFEKAIKEKKEEESLWEVETKVKLEIFAYEMDDYLERSRMNGFDQGSPLDVFYALLLLEEDACDTLRLLYKVMFS